MKLFTTTRFRGHWPVGTSAVVVAPNRKQAAAMLEAELRRKGLGQPIEPSIFTEVSTSNGQCIVLNDGDY